MNKWLLRALIVWGFSAFGCTTIPRDIQIKALPAMPFGELIEKTQQNIDKTVILGGYVLDVRIGKDETIIHLIQAPLGEDLMPQAAALSRGVIILKYMTPLDSGVYTKNRKVTVAGELRSSSATKDFQVPYPYIEIKATHIYPWPD